MISLIVLNIVLKISKISYSLFQKIFPSRYILQNFSNVCDFLSQKDKSFLKCTFIPYFTVGSYFYIEITCTMLQAIRFNYKHFRKAIYYVYELLLHL